MGRGGEVHFCPETKGQDFWKIQQISSGREESSKQDSGGLRLVPENRPGLNSAGALWNPGGGWVLLLHLCLGSQGAREGDRAQEEADNARGRGLRVGGTGASVKVCGYTQALPGPVPGATALPRWGEPSWSAGRRLSEPWQPRGRRQRAHVCLVAPPPPGARFPRTWRPRARPAPESPRPGRERLAPCARRPGRSRPPRAPAPSRCPPPPGARLLAASGRALWPPGNGVGHKEPTEPRAELGDVDRESGFLIRSWIGVKSERWETPFPRRKRVQAEGMVRLKKMWWWVDVGGIEGLCSSLCRHLPHSCKAPSLKFIRAYLEI